MATQNFERLNIKGKAMWCKVLEPDTKFNPDGDYSTDILIQEATAAPICEKLDDIVQKAFDQAIKDSPKLKNVLSTSPAYQTVYDNETGDPTGEIKFKAKLKAIWRARDGRFGEQRPVVVDSKLNPIAKHIAIGNGSDINVNVEVVPYVMQSTKAVGVSLRLKGIQVVNLVEYGNGTSMFGEVEGGFEAPDAPEESVPFEVESNDDSDQGDF